MRVSGRNGSGFHFGKFSCALRRTQETTTNFSESLVRKFLTTDDGSVKSNRQISFWEFWPLKIGETNLRWRRGGTEETSARASKRALKIVRREVYFLLRVRNRMLIEYVCRPEKSLCSRNVP